MSSNGYKNIGILRFEPIFRQVRWGGERLGEFKGIGALPSSHIGESWEISALPDNETAVAEGEYRGMTISELLKHFGERLVGRHVYERFGDFFPLLIKFIDAEDDLSIQVHPDDELAPENRGKTELWYIIKAESGSYIYSGFNRPLTRERLTGIMRDNSLIDVLAKHFSAPGDVFYLPAGRVHSIGAGNLLLEVQQTCGITYRLHDYNRLDTDGRPRELHIDKALDVIDYSQTDFGLARPQMLIDVETRVKTTPFFTVTAAQVMSSLRFDMKDTDSMRIVIAIAGTGRITDSYGNSTLISTGQTLLIPAESEYFDAVAISTPLKLITVFI